MAEADSDIDSEELGSDLDDSDYENLAQLYDDDEEFDFDGMDLA